MDVNFPGGMVAPVPALRNPVACCHGIIFPMQDLRNARLLARFVLACLVLWVGVATAAPLVKPQGFALVCTTAGVLKVLPVSEDLDTPAGLLHAFDCPLCVSVLLPLPRGPVLACFQASQAVPAHPAAPVHAVLRTASPLPARGPPSGA